MSASDTDPPIDPEDEDQQQPADGATDGDADDDETQQREAADGTADADKPQSDETTEDPWWNIGWVKWILAFAIPILLLLIVRLVGYSLTTTDQFGETIQTADEEIPLGMKFLAPYVLALSVANYLVLIIRMVHRLAGGEAQYGESEANRKDGALRDGLQFLWSRFAPADPETGDRTYNSTVLKSVQFSLHILTLFMLASVVYQCSEMPYKDANGLEMSCVTRALDDFPIGENWKPMKGAKRAYRSVVPEGEKVEVMSKKEMAKRLSALEKDKDLLDGSRFEKLQALERETATFRKDLLRDTTKMQSLRDQAVLTAQQQQAALEEQTRQFKRAAQRSLEEQARNPELRTEPQGFLRRTADGVRNAYGNIAPEALGGNPAAPSAAGPARGVGLPRPPQTQRTAAPSRSQPVDDSDYNMDGGIYGQGV